MALKDLTKHFKNPNINWRLRGQAFAQQFPVEVQQVHFGLYAHLDTNESPLPIYDRNGPGKVIVLAETTALKVGKFVGGLAARMLQNYDHFHRRPLGTPAEEGIFPDVLRCLLVLDLSHRPKESIRGLETAWKQEIRALLLEQNRVHAKHRGRAESINLAGNLSCAELAATLGPVADELLRSRETEARTSRTKRKSTATTKK